MGLPTYNRVNFRTERVFFTGTERLTEGQPLCYQESSNPASITISFPFDVELPNSDNRRVFAGIVAPSSVGETGPGYIDIIVPSKGDILQVQVSRAADVAVGTLLRLVSDLDTTTAQGDAGFAPVAAFVASTASASSAQVDAGIAAALNELPGLAQALESVPSTSANNSRKLAWVKFL